MALYRKFLDGVPEYLARHYWWAYLWRWGVWFFDHQPVINAILFGQYEHLMQKTLGRVDARPGVTLLQLTCVYGKLTPALLSVSGNDVHLCDVATGQLALARSKTQQAAMRCHLTRMNAEQLAYGDDAFDQVVVFFLFHELPPEARNLVYCEIARVVRPGGSVLITEYAPAPRHHLLYRLPSRWMLEHLEPFLPGFWNEDISVKLGDALAGSGKTLKGSPVMEYCFDRFYQVARFDIAAESGIVRD